MQNIEYLAEKVREENSRKMRKEKERQYYDVIAESKISVIKLRHFAKSEGLFNYRTLKLMFIGSKILQWFSIVTIVVYTPSILFYLSKAISLSEIFEVFVSRYNITLIGTIFSISICGAIIGFLGSKYTKLQLQIESNRNIAAHLAEEIDENLRLAGK